MLWKVFKKGRVSRRLRSSELALALLSKSQQLHMRVTANVLTRFAEGQGAFAVFSRVRTEPVNFGTS